MIDLGYYKEIEKIWLDSSVIFDELKEKNKLNKRQKKEIENKLKVMSYWLWLNDPKMKNKQWKQEVFLDLLNYLNDLNSSSNAVRDIDSSNSTKPVM